MLNYKDLHFSSDQPYPAAKATEPNITYARWMLDNMGGPHSEMSTISLYIYNNMVMEKKFEDIIYVFHKISIVEMHHLSIFGELACSLGEDPRLWTQGRSRKQYWSPGYNKYTHDLHGLMHNALEGEQAAIEKYTKQIASIEDKDVTACLKRIISDEELHVDIFKQIIRIYQL